MDRFTLLLTLVVGTLASLLATGIYFVVSFVSGEDLTQSQQNLVIGLAVLGIGTFLVTFVSSKLEAGLRKKYRSELKAEFAHEFYSSLEGETGITKIFANFSECEQDILDNIKSARNVSIFLQMGKTVLSGTTNFYDYLAEARLQSNASIRILHAHIESHYLTEKVAHERKSDYNDWVTDLDYAARKVDTLSGKENAGVVGRQHGEGYFCRLFIFDDCAYFQPYLFKRDNSQRAPVLLLSRFTGDGESRCENETSLYKCFVSYFDFKWEENRPDTKYIDEVVQDRSRSAVATVAKLGQFYVFAVPTRYIARDSKEVPFHGLGGKLRAGEKWLDALHREVKEEAGVEVEIQSSSKTRYITTAGEFDSLKLEKPSPYCVYKRTWEEDPNFAQRDTAWLVGFESKIVGKSMDDLKPRAELGALVCLTGDMLRKTLHDRILYEDIKRASDGSRVILGQGVSLDMSRRAVPSGLATIFAADQRPRLFHKL